MNDKCGYCSLQVEKTGRTVVEVDCIATSGTITQSLLWSTITMLVGCPVSRLEPVAL
jgi:hypothetical protein